MIHGEALWPGVVVSLVVAVYVTRWLPPYVSGMAVNSDAYAHFLIIRGIRENDHRIPEDPPRSYLPGSFSYPCLLHVALSWLPVSWYERVNHYFSPVMDVVFALLIVTLYPLGVLSIEQTALATFFFLATPQFVRPGLPHTIGLSGRKPGLLFASASTLSFTMWLLSDGIGWLVLSVLLIALTALTVKFSVQALLGIYLGFGIADSPIALATFVGGLLLATLVSLGYYVDVLVNHVRFSYDYAIRKQYNFLYDGLKSVDTVRSLLAAESVRDVLSAVYHSLFLRSLIDNPVAPLVLVGYAVTWWHPNVTVVLGVFDIWFLAGTVCFCVTSLYHVRFLGHASRYLEHNLLAGVVILNRFVAQLGARYRLLVLMTGLGGLMTVFGYVYVHDMGENVQKESDLQRVVTELADLPQGRVLVQPRFRGVEIAWKTPHCVNDYTGNAMDDSGIIDAWDRWFPEKEGWVTTDVEWLESEYDPDWVVFDTTFDETFGLAPNSDATPLLETDSFLLYPFEAIDRRR